jgi:hypothetical protein
MVQWRKTTSAIPLTDTSRDQLRALVAHLEQNLRASGSAGLTFIDARDLQARLRVCQNHAVFGRRGAGKSSLVKSLTGNAQHLAIRINVEDYKDISFPNILLQILRACFLELDPVIRSQASWLKLPTAWRFRRQLRRKAKVLNDLLYEPDKEEHKVKTKVSSEDGASAGFQGASLNVKADIKDTVEKEVSRTIPVDKLARLQLELTEYKLLFRDASHILNGSPIFLILDDFYFVPKSVQPEFVDFFHRLTKDTPLYLKLATIKHRSRLYKTTAESYVGAELGHDIYEIDMDYTLDKFGDLKAFMEDLLNTAIKEAKVDLQLEDFFSGEAFGQLCLASGGVPRDFLSLFVRLANAVVAKGRKIGKVEVNEEAIATVASKMDAFKVDSAGEREILEHHLNVIRRTIYNEHRTNAFLVAKDELEQHPQARQAIRELVDLRLIHLIDSNTSSAPSDGRRYEAYILDVGLYENSRPRNFTQVEPGSQDSRSRKDQLRASPRLDLSTLAEKVRTSTTGQLILTSPS